MGSRSDRDEVTRRAGNNHHHFAMACIRNGNYSCGFDSYDDVWRALTESQGLSNADLSRLPQAHHAVLRDRLRKNLCAAVQRAIYTDGEIAAVVERGAFNQNA
ncbi:MAG: hypothetical protein WCH75_24035 [Candidatus Binatia bacterium]